MATSEAANKKQTRVWTDGWYSFSFIMEYFFYNAVLFANRPFNII